MTVEAQHEAFVAELVDVVDALGVPVLGAYVLGSALLGGFDARTSDLDLVVVVARRLDSFERAALVRSLDELRVPARKLELVVYAVGAKPPAYELNYPDGDEEPPHWFVIDAAIAQELAKPFTGRPWDDLLEALSDEEIKRAVQESLDWSLRQPPSDEFAQGNAARSRHYLEHGEWITKKEASA
jgi:predicted nucleotidyltransferase